MVKKSFYIIIILSIFIFSLTTIKIANEDIYLRKNNTNNEVLGKIIIKKLNINKTIYNKDSINNNVDKNITILNESILPNKENSIVILAAHSGTGKIAYFNNLNRLQKNDKIELIIKNEKYNYYVKDYWEEKKDGYINVNKEKENQLVLTTCSPNNKGYQLIVNCIEKES